jgi:hypothetical protein
MEGRARGWNGPKHSQLINSDVLLESAVVNGYLLEFGLFFGLVDAECSV